MYKFLSIFLCLLIIFSCHTVDINDDSEIFTYSYDYQFYGLDNENCNFKATTVSTLKSVIDNNKTSIFLISSPTCLSCKRFVEILNDLAIDNKVHIYNIDSYSDLYPVYNTSDFDLLLDILKEVGINSESDYVMPILLIINKGVINEYIVGCDTNLSNDLLINRIKQAIDKSILIK